MATLYLVQQGTTLRREQERFLIKTETKGKPSKQEDNSLPLEIPIREVEQILVYGNVQAGTYHNARSNSRL
jgi:CRISP-associated protein Cas1